MTYMYKIAQLNLCVFCRTAVSNIVMYYPVIMFKFFPTDNEVPTQTEARPIETTEPQPATVTSNTPPQSRKERSPSPTKARKKSPVREPTQENKSTARNTGRRHSSDKQERECCSCTGRYTTMYLLERSEIMNFNSKPPASKQ